MTDPVPDTSDRLATPTDLGHVSLGTLDQSKAEALLDWASGEARDFCGWHISEKSYDLTLNGPGAGLLFLPAMAVTAVESVTVDGKAWVENRDYRWSSAGIIEAIHGKFPKLRRGVQVEFTAGHNPVPGAVISAVCQLASKAAASPGGFTSQRIGSLSLSGGDRGGSDDAEVDGIKAVLSRYRLP